MAGAAVAFAYLNAAAKQLSRDYPTAEIVFFRAAGHLLFALALFGPRFGRRLLRTRDLPSQLARSLMLLLSTIFYFAALAYLGLADAAALSFVSPFIVALLAAPLLGERVGATRWTVILVGFAGVLLVLRPGAGVARLAALLVVASATCSALYQILTRRVAASDPPETSVGYSALVGSGVMAAALPFVWTPPRGAADALLLLSLGPVGALGHYCVARAYLWGPAATVSPFNYLQLVGAAGLGFLVFGDVPPLSLWAGSALIVGSGLALAALEGRERGRR
jgi:drug/metabolite transporter (DMT)-like permease